MKQFNSLDQNTASILEQSSLLVGESVFTSILFYKRRLLFLQDHLIRLQLGAKFLFDMDLDISCLENKLLEQLKNSYEENCSVRITVVREGYFISLRSLTDQGISSLIFSKSRRAESIKPSYLKLADYALSYRERNLYNKETDCIQLSFDHMILETTTSNIFWVNQQNIICTPWLSSMNLGGVVRTNLIKFFNQQGIKWIEGRFNMTDILNSKEVFITNSIKGIQSIKNVEEVNFESTSFCDNLIANFGKFGELYYE